MSKLRSLYTYSVSRKEQYGPGAILPPLPKEEVARLKRLGVVEEIADEEPAAAPAAPAAAGAVATIRKPAGNTPAANSKSGKKK